MNRMDAETVYGEVERMGYKAYLVPNNDGSFYVMYFDSCGIKQTIKRSWGVK